MAKLRKKSDSTAGMHAIMQAIHMSADHIQLIFVPLDLERPSPVHLDGVPGVIESSPALRMLLWISTRDAFV